MSAYTYFIDAPKLTVQQCLIRHGAHLVEDGRGFNVYVNKEGQFFPRHIAHLMQDVIEEYVASDDSESTYEWRPWWIWFAPHEDGMIFSGDSGAENVLPELLELLEKDLKVFGEVW